MFFSKCPTLTLLIFLKLSVALNFQVSVKRSSMINRKPQHFCYPNSNRMLRRNLRICKVACISFICKIRKTFRSSHRMCSIRKGFIKKFCKIHRKTPFLQNTSGRLLLSVEENSVLIETAGFIYMYCFNNLK